MKRVVGNAIHIPLTHAELSTASARGPGLQRATGGKWPTCLETISRLVAAYHHAASAAEHVQPSRIAADISKCVHVLRKIVHGEDQVTADFLTMLHEWVENRAVNMTLQTTLSKAFEDHPFWGSLSDQDRQVSVDIVVLCVEVVRVKGAELTAAMKALRVRAHLLRAAKKHDRS